MLRVIRHAHEAMHAAAQAEGHVDRILRIPAVAEIARMSAWGQDEAPGRARALMAAVDEQVGEGAGP